MRDVFRALAEAADEGDLSAMAEIDLEAMTAAAQRLEDYANSEC